VCRVPVCRPKRSTGNWVAKWQVIEWPEHTAYVAKYGPVAIATEPSPKLDFVLKPPLGEILKSEGSENGKSEER